MAQDNDVTRRDFVKAASAVSAVAAALPAAQGAPFIQKVHAANEQVQYGFIGTGSRGTYLLKHLHETDAGRCVAVCDNWDVNLKKGVDTAGNNPATYKDYRELLARKDIDAVLIAVPLYEHFPITKDSLQAGKHVFCEKSLVHKPRRSARAARAGGRTSQTSAAGGPAAALQPVLPDRQADDRPGRAGQRDAHPRRSGIAIRTSGARCPIPRSNARSTGACTASMPAATPPNWLRTRSTWPIGCSARTPEYVIGVGGIDTFKDGRDVYDNIQLIYVYPNGRKLLYSSISTSSHLDLLQAQRQEFGEVIMGTAGAIEITIGDDNHPATALWYREPKPVSAPDVKKATDKKETFQAGATMTTAAASRGIPLLLPKDSQDANDSFLTPRKQICPALAL